ncbi:MAG: hypothetical protein A3H28_15960 [Acidobacteria bacterium RIFCSPLOWO2_02_FULL_61_28]|nr:MAG: hypothetical protein A3H28_15960 [Acidobacteria bacterium RIFCSPLOWO2_02_FULL_61_28]
MNPSRILLLSVAAVSALSFVATSIRAYPGGPPPGVTGGFGERTCNQSGCHNSYELNAGRTSGLGDLVISGVPDQYQPGMTYSVRVTITHTEGRDAWGFQLAARVKESGAQAGEFKPTDGTTQTLLEKGIQYIEHTLEGTNSNVFEFNWVAPSSSTGEIVLHAAGNAADGSLSPDGDYIYSSSATLRAPTASARLPGTP